MAYGKHTAKKRSTQKYQESGSRRAKEEDDRSSAEVGADCSWETGRQDGKAEA